MKKPRRKDIVPGTLLTVRQGKSLTIDSHLYLSVVSSELLGGTSVIVVTGPRKRDGINLVRVRIDEYHEHECFYCDVLKQCELVVDVEP